MKTYLINENDNYSIIKAKGFVPQNSVGVVPVSIQSADYPYLKSREIPHPDFPEQTIKEIYVDEDAKTAALAQKIIDDEENAWNNLRLQRDIKLKASDFTQLSDAPLTAEQILEWQTYRQALRDLPANTVDVLNPVWPSKPE